MHNESLICKKEILIYGYQLLLSSMFTILTIIVSSFLFYNWYEAFTFLLFFIPIRLFAGGYHASTYHGCFLCSNCCFHSVMLFERFTTIHNTYVAFIIFIGSCIYILINCPIIHPNNILSDIYCKKNKKHMYQTLSIEFIFIIFLLYFNPLLAREAAYTTLVVAFMVYKAK